MSTYVNMAIKQLINKNGKVELESYEDVKALRKALIND